MKTRTKNNTLAEIAEFLKTLDRVAVTTHVGSDGDAIGASAALVRLMRRLGAEAVFCHAEGAPEYLGWLLPDEPLYELPPDHDLLVAEYNLVSPRAAATAEIVADLYAELDVPIDRPTAEALYVGLRTDTGGFNFRNISPRAHELVADLLRAGVVPAEVNERINRRGSVEQLRIVGVSLANAVRYGDALISTVENADYERTGATEVESKESIDQLRTVAGVDVVAHLREVPQGTKGSLRSETVDVGEVARHFGGGGHRLAAGYTMPRRPDEAREELLEILEGVLDLGGER